MRPHPFPPELIGEILRFLNEDDLRLAAAVCREFYLQAWRAGLLIHREFNCRPDPINATDFTVLSEVVHHVVKKDLRLALTLVLFDRAPTGDPVAAPSVPDALHLLTIAMSVLVKLSLVADHSLGDNIAVALCHHAPHLRALHLHIYPAVVPGHPIPVLSAVIFHRNAQNLRVLTLEGVHLPAHPVAAFARVVSLTLRGPALRLDTVLVKHFPALQSVFLSAESGITHPTPAMSYNMKNTQLQWLVIADPVSATLMFLHLCGHGAVAIPDVVYRCQDVEWARSNWRMTSHTPFSIPTTAPSSANRDAVRIFAVPAYQRQYRGYELIEWFAYMSVPVSDLASLVERLTYLRMDNYYVTGFLESTDDVFQALVEIKLDCISA